MAEYSGRCLRDDSSESSGSEIMDDHRDRDYVPGFDSIDDIDDTDSNGSSGQDNAELINVPVSENDPKQSNLITNIDFASDLSLNPIVKTKSKSHAELWKLFGVLMKSGKILEAMSLHIFCSLCFEKEKLTRFVKLSLLAVSYVNR